MVIAYGEWFCLCDLQRREFIFRIRDEAQALRTLCGKSFITVKKETEKASDIDARRETESAPHLS